MGGDSLKILVNKDENTVPDTAPDDPNAQGEKEKEPTDDDSSSSDESESL